MCSVTAMPMNFSFFLISFFVDAISVSVDETAGSPLFSFHPFNDEKHLQKPSATRTGIRLATRTSPSFTSNTSYSDT